MATKISIVGTENTGKTVFLAVLANSLSSAKDFPRITGENMLTRRYTAERMDELENGQWPPSTPANVKRELKWTWYDRDGDPHELGTFDCAGQDFRIIFESESDDELNEKQRTLKNDFHACDLVLLLLNLQEALDIYKKPGKSTARIDIEYAPSAAVRQLRKDGVTLYAVFAQSDLYAERIKSEWKGDYSAALRDLLPHLYNALQETGSQYAVVNAVETEIVDGKRLPKKECHTGDIGDVVRAVDDFFAKRKAEARQRQVAAEALAAEEAAKRQREKQEILRRREEAEKARLAQLDKEAGRKRKLKFGLIAVCSIFALVIAFSGIKCSINAHKQARLKEEQRIEQERIRIEQKNAAREAAEKVEKERQAAEEKANAERKAAEEKAAEERRIAEEAADRAKLKAEEEQERLRIKQEALARKAAEEKAAGEKADALAKKFSSPHQVVFLKLDMQPIPAGNFIMGSPEDEAYRTWHDESQRRVKITKPFWIGKYPVTQEQYEKLMGRNPSRFTGPSRPVERVNWADAMEFCQKLNEQEITKGNMPEGYEYTLPTEAQWEYACRAGTTTPFYTGNNLTTAQGNYNGKYPYVGNAEGMYRERTLAVGSYRANNWGLHDMHGNIWEWCLDWYGIYPTGALTDPVGPNSGSKRICRGGSWNDRAQHCRSAYRSPYDPNARNDNVGFRIALSPIK